MNSPLTSDQIAALRLLDSCSVANAIESFDVRLRNEGFTDPSLCCFFPDLPPLVGYAATLKVRCSTPAMGGPNYPDRTDWWEEVLKVPTPRILVIEDVDPSPGTGALVGDVHASILRALGCYGVATNGAVRDLPAVEPMRFHLFAAHAAVSHAYVHVVEAGTPVTISGLVVRPGDLLHGDLHGIVNVPLTIAPAIPAAAAEIARCDRAVIEACEPHGFSLERLREAVRCHPRMRDTR